jgi:cytochrome c biogenesis factor
VLTSVHSFASDPTRGVFILAILTAFIGGALALFAWRAPEMKQGGLFAPISREGAWCSTICSWSQQPLLFWSERFTLGLGSCDWRQNLRRRAVF